MHRQPLLELLDGYQRSGRVRPSERASLERLVGFVRRCPDCFERSLEEGHITGSAWLLNFEGDACLLTHHRKLGLWLQPGGHADGDPDVLAVALREAHEESGIEGIEPVRNEIFDVDVHTIPATATEPQHLHYDVRFLLRAPEEARLQVSPESHALEWVTREDIGRYRPDRSILRMADKWDFRG